MRLAIFIVPLLFCIGLFAAENPVFHIVGSSQESYSVFEIDPLGYEQDLPEALLSISPETTLLIVYDKNEVDRLLLDKLREITRQRELVRVFFRESSEFEFLEVEAQRTDVAAQRAEKVSNSLNRSLSIGIAARSALFSYGIWQLGGSLTNTTIAFLMNTLYEIALYVPKMSLGGKMPITVFFDTVISKSKELARRARPSSSSAPNTAATVSNVLANYLYTVLTLIPFLGLDYPSFQEYLHYYTQKELYVRSLLLAAPNILIASSWQIALNKWNQSTQDISRRLLSNAEQAILLFMHKAVLSLMLPSAWRLKVPALIGVSIVSGSAFVAMLVGEETLREIKSKSTSLFQKLRKRKGALKPGIAERCSVLILRSIAGRD
jgi:hypothetical protein